MSRPFALSPPSDCLSEETISAFAQGCLSSEMSARVDTHIAECQACFLVVTEAAKGYSAEGAPTDVEIAHSRTARPEEVVSDEPRFARGGSPRVLGRYALYGDIASGGMATVHFGRLLGPVGFARTVAIKRLHSQFAKDPEFVSMFLDEARLAARIRHPNVVATIDVVATDGELFLVMEYVQGETLARLTRLATATNERIAPEIACAIMVGVLHGLHAAHEATDEHGTALGIVHRDVSPQNILVGTDGVPRVLDFGVAKAAGRVHTTQEGKLKGKLAYMPPEQIRGKVNRATDVYAASVVLWETLVGGRLFKGDNEAEVLDKVLHAPVDPPSRRAKGVPALLDAVTLRGLERDVQKRFATARDMARALEKVLPLVGASDIGDWVDRLARRSLRDRAEQVARIESGSTSSFSLPDTLRPLQDDKSASAGAAPGRRMGRRSLSAVVGLAVAGGLLVALRQGGAPQVAPAVAAEAQGALAPAAPPSFESPQATSAFLPMGPQSTSTAQESGRVPAATGASSARGHASNAARSALPASKARSSEGSGAYSGLIDSRK